MSKKMKHGTCRLCDDETSLCDSHIVSELFYKRAGVYDESHKMNLVTFEENDIKSDKELQKGEREYLLCRKCEDLFRDEETYFCTFLNHSFNQNMGAPSLLHKPSKDYLYAPLTGINFDRFKYLFLSIAWRAIISETLTSYSACKSDHTELITVIKSMLKEKSFISSVWSDVKLLLFKNTEIIGTEQLPYFEVPTIVDRARGFSFNFDFGDYHIILYINEELPPAFKTLVLEKNTGYVIFKERKDHQAFAVLK